MHKNLRSFCDILTNMKLFIFDMGDVILLEIRTLMQIAKYVDTDYHDIRKDYGYYDRALMDGYMDAEDYYRHLEDKYQCKIKEDLFVEFFKPHINEYMLGVVDELRKRGHRCVIGSNTFRPHWDYIKTFPGNPLCHFDATYASHLIHMSKPESSFWKIICEKEGFDYANTLFIDDRKENTEAATTLGIDSLLYTGEDRDEKARAFFSRFI